MDLNQQPSTQFLTLEESAKVDAALLSSPEKFLARLTISSQRLLQQIVAWFEKDSEIRREQGIDAAYLKW